jgi:hypothetical protein
MSNRLTFSLTSLILIFAFGIIAMPVMAAPPTFDSTAPATITLTIGETYEVLLPPATDPDGGVLTYTLEPKTASGDNADPGLLTIGFNFAPNTRLLTATADLPTGSLTGESGTYVYTASAAAVGAETDAETVTHEIAITVNSSVSFAGATISDMKWKVGRDIEVRLPQATDSRTGSAVAYSITTPPSGVSFNTSLRYLTGAPDTAAAEAEFTYTATGTANGNNAAAELKFKITVATDSDPVFGPEAVGDITGTVGMAITRVQLPTATDADGDEITHRLTPDLPAGLTFDSTLFLIEGTPTAMTVDADGMQAAVAYTWTATDADGPITGTTAASKTFNINIAAAPTPDPTPVAFASGASIDDQTYTTGMEITALELPAAMAGTGTGDLTYSLTPARPAGLSFDAETRMLSGTPTAAAVGATYTYKVTDSAATPTEAMLTFMITVSDPVAADPDIAQPTNVMAMAQNDGSVMVTWDWMGTDAEMTALDGFTVMWNPEAEVPATARSYTIPASDLTAGSETTVSVLARATADSGFATPAAPSAMSDPVTPVDPAVLRFEPDSIDDMTFTAGEAIGTTAMPYVQLPRAYGGTGLYTYSLLKGIGKVDVTDGDNGLSVDRTNLRLMGTPTAEAASTIYTWRVTDAQAHGDIEAAIELEFNITVNAADTVPPDVVISIVGASSVSGTPYTFTGEPMAKLTFLFDFTGPLSPAFTTTDIHRSVGGDNFRLLADSDPRPVPGVADAFTVVVTVIDINLPTTVLIKRLEIADAAKNLLQNDRYATYSPTTTAPVATITASGPFNCGIDGNPVTVTITDNEAIGSGQAIAAGEITVSKGWQIRTGTFRASTAAKTARATFNVVRKDVENGADRTWLGERTVTITVAANAVLDDTSQGNAAQSNTYTAGPVITVPAGEFVVVIRDSAWRSSHLNAVRTLFLGDYNVRADNIQVQPWDCMPDLGLIFDTTVDASPGIGGGGLMILQSPDHTGTAIGKGTVGISEVMWSEDRGIPFGRTSNLEHAREQWIEIHNTNTFDVKVTLFELIREEAYRDPAGNHATVIGNYAGLIDVMANYDIGGRWTVKGQDGNSELGTDFVSMWRHKNGNKYDHGDNNGRNKDKWKPSESIYLTRRANLANTGQVPLEDLNYHFTGTPGRANTFHAPGPRVRTAVPNGQKPDGSRVIFNEIANRRDQTLEWIELKNVSDKDVDLRNYEITIVTGVDQEARFFHFNYGDNQVIIKAGELLLLVDTDPRYDDDHPVAVGYNVRGGNDQVLGIGDNAPRYLVTNFAEGGLPDSGEFVLILRSNKGEDYENKKTTQDRVVDLIGYHPNLAKQSDPHYTNLWPMRVFGAPHIHNKIELEKVHDRQHEIAPDQATHGDKKVEHLALRDVGYTGVGYKRHAQQIAAHGGSPGYEHGTSVALADAKTDEVGRLTISEIMFDQGDGRYAQWIEIYNSSDQPVDLHGGKTGWKLFIENYDDGEIPIDALSGTLNFRNSDVKTVLPKQTVIVASTRARNSGSAFFDTAVVFPPTRVFSVWDDARGELAMRRSTDPILSTEGFYIELIDGGNDARPSGYVSDSVGNLVRSPNRRVAAEIEWQLSDITGEMVEGMERSSILRLYHSKYEKNTDRTSDRFGAIDWSKNKYTPAELLAMGITAEGWIAASKTEFREVRETWFGHPDDYGSPGITGGRVLPVSLSKFRPERLDDGTVVIRWLTESETNNAGFNILRSEERRGEFTKLNTQLIAGQGTTSERTNYEFADKSAKPNVVYYYQIQDVSLDGEVSILQITHLRGHVSAAGKATTTWGELKALQ